jgi:hypothetical protein
VLDALAATDADLERLRAGRAGNVIEMDRYFAQSVSRMYPDCTLTGGSRHSSNAVEPS